MTDKFVNKKAIRTPPAIFKRQKKDCAMMPFPVQAYLSE
jgi:hypothetical protein